MTLQEAIDSRDSLYDEQIIVIYTEYRDSEVTPGCTLLLAMQNTQQRISWDALHCTASASQEGFINWLERHRPIMYPLEAMHEKYRESAYWQLIPFDRFISWVHQLIINKVRPTI